MHSRAFYRALSRTATGPGPIYLYKPLLHLVLPSWLSHVIVLDTDLFLFSDIAGLWAITSRLLSSSFGVSPMLTATERAGLRELLQKIPPLPQGPRPYQVCLRLKAHFLEMEKLTMIIVTIFKIGILQQNLRQKIL